MNLDDYDTTPLGSHRYEMACIYTNMSQTSRSIAIGHSDRHSLRTSRTYSGYNGRCAGIDRCTAKITSSMEPEDTDSSASSISSNWSIQTAVLDIEATTRESFNLCVGFTASRREHERTLRTTIPLLLGIFACHLVNKSARSPLLFTSP